MTNWSGSCMIFVCLYEVNNTKNPSKKGMETDMSERKQAPETPWYLRPFGPLVSLALLCVVWGVYGKARLSGRRTRAQRAWQVVSQGCVYDLGRDLTRHNCFRYCNRGSLSSAYFAQATAALSDGYIYLALTHSNSPAGEVIGLFTGRAYNHISLAFDRALKTLVSYNGGEGGEAPGLNPETLKGLAERKGASVRVYRLAATRHQKQIMLKRLRKINQEGSAYNLLGLLFPMSCQPNIMFCSQFVYAMLRLAGLHYFRKNPLQVRPTDFVEWDRRGRLAFVAVTRAEKGLYLSEADGTNFDGSPRYPSRFLLDMWGTFIPVPEPQEGLLKAARGYAESSNRALPPDDGAVLLPVGQRVRHFVFGLGRVLDVDLNRGAHLVQFDDMETPRRISFRAKLEAWPEDAPSTGERQNSDYE